MREAFENLYARETVGWWSTFDEENGNITIGSKISGVQGKFGILANFLNNYLDQFGADDGYFDSLLQNLEKIDQNQNDSIVGQIKSMVSTVRGGKFINIHSSEFEKDTTSAILNAYVKVENSKQTQKNKEIESENEEKNFSKFEIDMQKTKETEQILDKFLGKESKNNAKSAGEIISENQNMNEDKDFKENLRNLDKPNDTENFTEDFEVEQTEDISTKFDEETISNRKSIAEAWEKIIEQL